MAKKYKKDWDREKKESKFKIFTTKNVLGAFIIFIMISSAVGFGYIMSQEENYDYKDTDISRTQNGFKANIDYEGKKTNIDFSYHPTSVEDIEIDNDFLQKMKTVPSFMILFDPSDEKIEYIELVRSDIEGFYRDNGGKVVGSFVTEEDADKYALYPVATCDSTTEFIPAIYIKTDNEINETGYSVEGNCLIFNARDEYDVVMLKDRLLYGLTGIIK